MLSLVVDRRSIALRIVVRLVDRSKNTIRTLMLALVVGMHLLAELRMRLQPPLSIFSVSYVVVIG